MIRVIVQDVREGAIKQVTANGRIGETFTGREAMEHYGFTSRPLAGAEAILIRDGNHILMIASDDRRYRIALENGEVALYTDEGDKVHLKRGREIEVVGGEKVTVSTKEALVEASVSATVTAPAIVLNGNVTVNGTLHATGAVTSAVSVADPTGTMAAMRLLYNAHTHGESGTTTSPPAPGM